MYRVHVCVEHCRTLRRRCPICLFIREFGAGHSAYDIPFAGRVKAPLSRCTSCAVLVPQGFQGGCSVIATTDVSVVGSPVLALRTQ
jgi:hypothetical protein